MNPRPIAKVGSGGSSQSDDSSGDGSGENLVVKRAWVGVIPGWVIERKVLSATPLGSIEARGNSGRRPVGVGSVGLPLCRNKSVRVGWTDVGKAEAWVSYQSIGTQSGQYLSSDPGWWDLTRKGKAPSTSGEAGAAWSRVKRAPTNIDKLDQVIEQVSESRVAQEAIRLESL
ncbi:hypothetical protein ACLOJK_007941 [Asimina triloba]